MGLEVRVGVRARVGVGGRVRDGDRDREGDWVRDRVRGFGPGLGLGVRLEATYPRGALLARTQGGVGESEPERLSSLHAHKGDAHLVTVRVRGRVRVRADVRRMRMRQAQP